MSQIYDPLFIPNPILRTYLVAILAGFNPFPSKDVHLFQRPFLFTNDTVLADIPEANFQGYALQSAFNWGTPYFDGAGQLVMSAGNFVFTATGPGNPNLIGGWYLTDAANTTFVWGQNLSPPVGVKKSGDVVTVEPYFLWPQQPEGAF